MSDGFLYQGSELDLFAKAANWKHYWGDEIGPFLGKTVLEVGAGTGSTARLLCNTRQDLWLALEPDSQLVARMIADQKSGFLPHNFQAVIGTTADLKHAPFDTALYIDVLEHIKDDRGELARASDALGPGGHLVVLAPAHQLLFTAFDESVGHFRRYGLSNLSSLAPSSMKVVKAIYLDSVGLLASLGNKTLLRSALPTARQIAIWDKGMVPISRVLDRLVRFSLGKSALVVWRKSAG